VSKGGPGPANLKAVIDQLAAAEAERASKLSPRERRARTVARLSAVQALYQLEIGGEGVDTVVREFREHRFDADLEGEPLGEADEDYFEEIVRGVVEHQQQIDRAVIARLAEGWKLERIDATVRAILRAGAFVELAKAFFDPAEAKFVNAALDGVARDLRG
jgi:N utilization substance protein B